MRRAAVLSVLLVSSFGGCAAPVSTGPGEQTEPAATLCKKGAHLCLEVHAPAEAGAGLTRWNIELRPYNPLEPDWQVADGPSNVWAIAIEPGASCGIAQRWPIALGVDSPEAKGERARMLVESARQIARAVHNKVDYKLLGTNSNAFVGTVIRRTNARLKSKGAAQPLTIADSFNANHTPGFDKAFVPPDVTSDRAVGDDATGAG
jgi:hypothetical protein